MKIQKSDEVIGNRVLQVDQFYCEPRNNQTVRFRVIVLV